MPNYVPWTQDEIDLLLEEYRKSGMGMSKKVTLLLAEKLNRSPLSIKCKAYKLGLSMPNKQSGFRKAWSKEEDLFLQDHAGIIPFKLLCLKFNKEVPQKNLRSPIAIKKRIFQLGLRTRLQEGNGVWYTLADLASCLNCSKKLIANWLKDREYFNKLKPINFGDCENSFFAFSQTALAAFFKAYPGEVAKCKPDIVWLIDILS